MSGQRVIAFVLTAASAAIFALTSRSYAYAGAISLLALLGVPGRIQWKLSRARRLILVLLLGALFAAKFRYSPFHDVRVTEFVFYPFAHAVGQFTLAYMAMQFVLHRPGGVLAVSLPFYATVVTVCAGDVMLQDQGHLVYRCLTMAIVALSVVYFIACRPDAARPARAAYPLRAFLILAVLAVGVGGAWVSGTVLRQYEHRIERFARWLDGHRGIGLSDSSRLESILQIQAESGSDVAVRVFSRTAPGYLRAFAFDSYSESRWGVAPGDGVRRLFPAAERPDTGDASRGRLFLLREGPAAAGETLDIWPSPDASITALLHPHEAAALRVPAEELTLNDNGVVHSTLPGGVNYLALVPRGGQEPQPLPPAWRVRYLSLPPNMEPRALETGRLVTAGCDDFASRVAAVVDHLRGNHEYSLEMTVPPGRDPLSYFLTSHAGGHCEYFATAATVLLRMSGVPARYVTGLVATRRNAYGGYWFARSQDAHAWVEAWDDSHGRWVTVEATPASGLPGQGDDDGLGQWWDNLKFRLQELRVAIYLHGLKGVVVWLLDLLVGLGKFLVGTVGGLAVSAALICLLAWRYRRLWRWRRHAKLPDPAMVEFRRLVGQVDRWLRKRGLVRGPAETLHQFSRRLEARTEDDRREAATATDDRNLDEAAKAPDDRNLAEVAGWYRRCACARYGGQLGPEDLELLRESMPAGQG